MKIRSKVMFGAALAALLVLSGCGAQDASETPAAAAEAEEISASEEDPSPEKGSSSEEKDTRAEAPAADEAPVGEGPVDEAPVDDPESFNPEDGEQSVLSDEWSYDRVFAADGTEILTFNDEVRLTLPADWTGQYTMLAVGDHVTFLHTASLEAWRAESGFDGGVLFTLTLSEIEPKELESLPDYKIIGSTENGVYYLTFPTDVQAYYEDPAIMDSYSALSAATGEIRTTAEIAG